MFSKKPQEGNKKEIDKKNRNFFDSRNPEVLEVNLVKDEILIFFDWRKHILTAIFLLILAGLFIFEISLGLNSWETRENAKAAALQNETEILKKEVVDLNNKVSSALLFKDKSLAFGELLGNHIYWTNFFSWLEKNTLSTVKFKGFSGDLSGKYSLSATAPTYAEAAWQVKVLSENPMIQEVEISSIENIQQRSGEGEDAVISSIVSFVLEFTVKPEIFKK